MPQRNHRAEALKRFATQIPEWASWGGRTNAYALEWDSTTRSGTDFYSATLGTMVPDSAYVFWVKPTATLASGATNLGLFSWFSPTLGGDVFSLNIEHNAGGNALQLRFGTTGVAIGSANVIGTAWTNVVIIFGAASLDIHVNGILASTNAMGALFNDTELVLGRTFVLGVDHHLKDCIVDELAIFESSATLNPVSIYNSGVPPSYTPSTSGLLASYEVEKDTGAITANHLFPTVTATGASPPSFSWGSTGNKPSVTTSALRSISTNPFRERVSRLSAWVSGTAVTGSSSYAVSGTDISSEAPGLMAMPAGGGYSTLGYTGAFVGNEEKPHVTPRLAVSGSGIGTDDSTTYAAVGGTSSLGGVVDARERRLFLPRFVKR